MYSFSKASQESLRQVIDNAIDQISDAWSNPASSKLTGNASSVNLQILEPPVTDDDTEPTFAHRQLWYKRLEVARRYSDQGRIDEMTSHIKQTGEIIDNTLRYLRYQGARGDESCSEHHIDGLTEYGEEIKAATKVLLDQCRAQDSDAGEPMARGSGDSGTVA